MEAEPTGGKDRAIAVIATEPEVLFYMITADAHTGQFTDTINAYIGHLDKDTLAVAPPRWCRVGSRPPPTSGNTSSVPG